MSGRGVKSSLGKVVLAVLAGGEVGALVGPADADQLPVGVGDPGEAVHAAEGGGDAVHRGDLVEGLTGEPGLFLRVVRKALERVSAKTSVPETTATPSITASTVINSRALCASTLRRAVRNISWCGPSRRTAS